MAVEVTCWFMIISGRGHVWFGTTPPCQNTHPWTLCAHGHVTAPSEGSSLRHSNSLCAQLAVSWHRPQISYESRIEFHYSQLTANQSSDCSDVSRVRLRNLSETYIIFRWNIIKVRNTWWMIWCMLWGSVVVDDDVFLSIIFSPVIKAILPLMSLTRFQNRFTATFPVTWGNAISGLSHQMPHIGGPFLYCSVGCSEKPLQNTPQGGVSWMSRTCINTASQESCLPPRQPH